VLEHEFFCFVVEYQTWSLPLLEVGYLFLVVVEIVGCHMCLAARSFLRST